MRTYRRTARTAVVAEDDFIVAQEVTRILTGLGLEVVGEAANGAEAVRLTQEHKPDVVLMDIKMPKLDGLGASREIQEHCPTPVVILTAHETRELVDEASRSGVAAYVTKPPVADEVMRAIVIARARHVDLMTFRSLNEKLEEQKRQLERSLEENRILRGIIPICSSCKKIRNDGGYWEQVEVYIRNHTDADFSHGICPDCYARFDFGPTDPSGS